LKGTTELAEKHDIAGRANKPHSNIARGVRFDVGFYRWEEFRRALARAAERSAPADPTSASTTVEFSGESVQPVCACRGIATNSNSAHPMNPNVSLVITILTQ
jgi:hypothetical protein